MFCFVNREFLGTATCSACVLRGTAGARAGWRLAGALNLCGMEVVRREKALALARLLIGGGNGCGAGFCMARPEPARAGGC
jgi:hypothetical protein